MFKFFKLYYTYKAMLGLSYIWKKISNFRKYNRVTDKPKERKPKKPKPSDRISRVHSVVINRVRLLADDE